MEESSVLHYRTCWFWEDHVETQQAHSQQGIAGFTSHIFVHAHNQACSIVSAQLTLVLDTALYFQGAVPPPTSISGDTLRWAINSMTFDSSAFSPILTVISDSTPGLNRQACLDLSITNLPGDSNPRNNSANICTPIFSSFDPNL